MNRGIQTVSIACALVAAACSGSNLGPAPDAGVEAPGVTLTTAEDAVCISQGSRVGVPVSVDRKSPDVTDVAVTIDATPGITAEVLDIPATESSGLLWIDAAPDAPMGSVTLTLSADGATATLDVMVGGAFGIPDIPYALPVNGAEPPVVLLAMQGDDVIVGATTLTIGTPNSVISRISNGQQDDSFGDNGTVTTSGVAFALTTRPDGTIAIGMGTDGTEAPACSRLTLLSPDGMDPQPLVASSTTCGETQPANVIAAPDHSLYVCGWLWNCCGFVEHYLADGSLDPAFGSNGAVTSDPYLDSTYGCALGPNGHLALAEYQGVQELDGTGSMVFDDTNLDVGPQGNSDNFSAIVVGSDGTVYAANSSSNLFWQLTPQGQFNPLSPSGAQISGQPVSLLLRADGLVVLTTSGLYRMTFRGEVTLIAPLSGAAQAVVADTCGRLIVASYPAYPYSSVDDVSVSRYWP